MKKSILILLILAFILTSCNKTEPVIIKEILPASTEEEVLKSSQNIDKELTPSVKNISSVSNDIKAISIDWTGSNNNMLHSWSIIQKNTDLALTWNAITNNSKKVILNTNNLQLSNEKINAFITKMEQTRVKSVNNILIQWDFKAEYIKQTDYTKPDFIKITQWNKEYTIPWPYIPNENQEYINCMKEKNLERACFFLAKWFLWFNNFSPSWYYLIYTYWESIDYFSQIMIDTKTWKIIKNIWFTDFFAWTQDKMQFIYWQWNEYFWTKGLYINKKWNFPEFQEVVSDYIEWLYVDETNIYIKSIVFKNEVFDFSENNIENYFKIIDLKTLQVIFIQEL